MQEINFKDINALESKVSEDFGAWGAEIEVTQQLINDFADLTGDHQWIHVDVEKCAEMSPFGGPIAHGFLVLVLMPKLTLPKGDYEIVGYRNIVNYGSDKLRFTGAVPAGSELRMRGRIAAVEARPKGTAVTMEMAIHVVGQDRPSVVYQMIMLYQ